MKQLILKFRRIELNQGRNAEIFNLIEISDQKIEV
jgi:hypothetical protein